MDVGKVILYKNIKGDDKKIVILEKIGQGAYGIVFKAMLENYGLIALKVQKLLPETLQSLLQSLKSEIKISEVLPENIAISLKKVLFHTGQGKPSEMVSVTDDVPKNYVATLYDLADGLELQKLIDINKNAGLVLSEDVIERYIRDLLQCLEGLKSVGVAHRDIKPGNLMLNKGNIIMIDFGFACFYVECTGKKGTPKFLPPEFFFLPQINWQKGDIFAMGITIISLITNGNTLYENYFQTKEQASGFFSVYTTDELRAKFIGTMDKYALKYPVINTYRELILGMIDPEPMTRWTIEQCFEWIDMKTYGRILDVTEDES
uniref:Protein kinase domain-containing protein n=1 Tax=viral metagenome TaxID=1070528 RepID=A0A6C0KV79_9ZZZZ